MSDWVREVEHASYSVQYAGPDPERRVLLPGNERESVFVRVFWVFFLTVLLGLGVSIGCYLIIQEDNNWPAHTPYILIDRSGWRAFPVENRLERHDSNHLLKYVVIADTNSTSCDELDDCGPILRYIQKQHIANRNLSDIAYNFMISGDGSTYEGRGWYSQPEDLISTQKVYANNTLYVAFIGSYDETAVPEEMCAELLVLLEEGIEKEILDECYNILIHKRNLNENKLHRIFDKLAAQNKKRKAYLKCKHE